MYCLHAIGLFCVTKQAFYTKTVVSFSYSLMAAFTNCHCSLGKSILAICAQHSECYSQSLSVLTPSLVLRSHLHNCVACHSRCKREDGLWKHPAEASAKLDWLLSNILALNYSICMLGCSAHTPFTNVAIMPRVFFLSAQ